MCRITSLALWLYGSIASLIAVILSRARYRC